MKFEYKTIKFATSGLMGGDVKTDKFDEYLNELGCQGWELVNAVGTNVGNGATKYIVAIFKKPESR